MRERLRGANNKRRKNQPCEIVADRLASIKKIEFTVTGKISGFQLEAETFEQARARLALEAEQRANALGDVRLHITVVDGDEI